jgi:Cu+-exporting ATPase
MELVRDPVCGVQLEKDAAKTQTMYAGETYYFCSQECRDTFAKHAENYANAVAHS